MVQSNTFFCKRQRVLKKNLIKSDFSDSNRNKWNVIAMMVKPFCLYFSSTASFSQSHTGNRTSNTPEATTVHDTITNAYLLPFKL